MARSPHLVRPACPSTARACGPFLFRQFAPLAASIAAAPLAARPPVAVITARGAPPKPAASPPRPACRPARGFPSLCPPKPATARRGASLARPPSAPFPPAVAAPPLCPLDGPPRPAAVRPLVTARPGAPKPATGRGSPPAVRLAARPPVRPSGLPGDHRPPPPAVRRHHRARRRPSEPIVKKLSKPKLLAFQKYGGTQLLTFGFHNRGGADFSRGFFSPNREKSFLGAAPTSAFLRRLADHNLRKFPSRNISRQTWRFSVKSSRTVMSVLAA